RWKVAGAFEASPVERHETTMSLQMLRGREVKPPLRAVRTRPDDNSGSQTEEASELPRIGGRPRPPALRFPVGAETREFYQRFYPGTSAAEWNDWHWQFRARIRSLSELSRIFKLSPDERAAVGRPQGPPPVGITPYYAS